MELPEEHEKKVRENARQILRVISSNREAKNAFDSLMDLASLLSEEFYTKFDRYENDREFARINSFAQQIIESYLGDHKLNEFLRRLRNVVFIIDNDHDFKSYLKKWREHIEAGLKSPEKLESDEYIEKGTKLVEEGKTHRKNYTEKPEVKGLVAESRIILNLIINDPHITKLQNQAVKVAKNFSYTDSEGKKRLDTNLLASMRAEVVPYIVDRVKEIPLQGFEVESPDFEYLKVGDLYLSVDDVFPDNISIHTENNMKLKMDKMSGHTHACITIEGVRPVLKDFYFSFKSKHLKDEGRADLRITGQGLKIEMKFELGKSRGGHPNLSNGKVEVHLGVVKIKIIEAHHKIILNIVKALLKAKIHAEVERAIKTRLESAVPGLGDMINSKILSNFESQQLNPLKTQWSGL
jgi:hypothetical protein